MKAIKQTLVLLALVIGMSGCASLFVNKDIMMQIQKGMTQEEVSSILGKPDYRRFDHELEEWEFVKYVANTSGPTTIIVGFIDGRVVSMDSFQRYLNPPVAVYPSAEVGGGSISHPHVTIGRGMNERDFQAFYRKVKSKPFKDDQLELIAIDMENKELTCSQCVRLMSIYTFDDEKLKVLDIVASQIADKENYDKIIDALSFISSQEKARVALGIKK
ncbi:DUF4476 domain-containing protein [Bacteroides sp. UBA939]|uniref:DUF4476 domain-containing protein n=1 Tax=Bacteroides sp. UBA939 TaxID=1946092 RepID=UPI0025BD1E35|nr:DUF4476 domain-containing protein [Bacteroides sp. UBA939]